MKPYWHLGMLNEKFPLKYLLVFRLDSLERDSLQNWDEMLFSSKNIWHPWREEEVPQTGVTVLPEFRNDDDAMGDADRNELNCNRS